MMRDPSRLHGRRTRDHMPRANDTTNLPAIFFFPDMCRFSVTCILRSHTLIQERDIRGEELFSCMALLNFKGCCTLARAE
jgi:hypothetical protein